MTYLYNVAGFTGYVSNLEELRDRINNLRKLINIKGETLCIYRNNSTVPGIFHHRGEPDRIMTVA